MPLRKNHLTAGTRGVSAFAVALGLSLAAGGAMAGSHKSAEKDEAKAAMEAAIRDAALTIGNAYACTDMDARPAFKLEAHHLFDLIVQDLGSDMAFTYATAIGAGSSVATDKIDCPAVLADWEEIREDYELKGDG